MGNLKKCSGCHRDLPRSMYPRQKELCFNCTFNGPGAKEDVMPSARPVLPLNNEIKEKEEVYVKHEAEVIDAIETLPGGLSTKEISQIVGISRDATYKICTDLVKMGKLTCTKEQRGAGKAQNIYHIPEIIAKIEGQEKQVVTQLVEAQNKLTPVYAPDLSWQELKNRLIKDGDCGTALRIMVMMEEEAHL